MGEPFVKQHRSKRTQKLAYRIVNIKRDIPEQQLAALGAVALAFNEVEAALDRFFYTVTDLSDPLQLEVSTRINGIDGKLGIAKAGAAQVLSGLDLEQLCDLLGEGWFKNLKDYRDGAIHARHVNAITGIGTRIDRKAEMYDYLVRKDALEAAYDILVVMRKELDEAVTLVQGIKVLKELDASDPNKAQHEAKISESRSRFRDCRRERQSLPPIPKFPSESELHAADALAQQAQTATLMSHYQPWIYPHFRRQFSPAFWNYLQNQYADTPHPLKESKTDETKKK
jgi:hypothetical protein